jgi:hypothetical protein
MLAVFIALSAHARAGSLEGVVFDASSVPVGGIEVSAFSNNGGGWGLVSFTETAADGRYRLDGLPAATYRVLFRDWSQTYAFEYHPDAPRIELAADVVVDGTVVIDAELDPAGRITGRVTDGTGLPLEFPAVFVYAAGVVPELLFVGQVDEPTGIYDVGGLPDGDYLMMFSGRRGTDSFVGYFDRVLRIDDATPIAVLAGEVTSGIDGVLGPPPGGYPGTMRGVVSEAGGGLLPGIEVSLYIAVGPEMWDLVSFTSSASDGSYEFAELPAGTYTVGFRDWNQLYAFEFWGGVSRLEDALPIEIDEIPVIADAALRIGGRIVGALTDPAGAPLSYATVFVHTYEDDPQVLFLSTPDPVDGSYQLGGLPTGDYIVQFTGTQGLASSSEYYDGALSPAEADPVAVLLGATTTGIDGTLGIPPGGVISGRITDPYGRAFDFARVRAFERDGTEWVVAGETETVYDEGEFELPLPPGDYALRFQGGSFLQFDLPTTEYYDDVSGIDASTPVPVVLDQRVEDFDVAIGNLAAGGLSGTVVDRATGAPLQGIEVWVRDRRGRVLYDQIAVTDSAGGYRVSGLWPEGYLVEFYDPDHLYGTLSIGQVLVGEGHVSGVDAVLEVAPAGSLPGAITGRVVDDAGNPVFGIRVSAETLDGSDYGFGFADSRGFYRIRDLDSGSYRIRFTSSDGFWVPEYYDDAREPDQATPVSVARSATTRGVDAELAPAGVITGTITNRFGGEFQIATAIAYAFDGTGWVPAEGTSIAYDSEYRLEGVPVGTYRVELLGRSFSGSPLREFFDEAPTIALATDVPVVAGEVTRDISGSLGEGPPGGIAGRVTDDAGAPLEGIEVTIYDDDFEVEATAVTGPDGAYEAGDLYRGRYYAEFIDPSGAYPAEAYDDVASVAMATPILVDDGTVPGIDAVLDGSGSGPGGGGFRGVVTDAATGAPIEGIRVRCVDEFFTPVAGCSAFTGVDGSYQLAGFLPAGTYFVQLTAANGGWADEWYDDVLRAQSATPLVVTEGLWLDGIDAELDPAGAISGSVSNPGGGAFPLLTVTAYRWTNGTWAPYKSTSRAYETDYALGGLPEGLYRVKFRGGSIFNPGSGIEEYFDDAPSLEEGTDVQVSVGVTTAGIDAILEARGPGAIGGLVTDGNGVGVEGIEVRVFDAGFEIEDEGVTGPDGRYTIDGLFSGRYYVGFADPGGVYPSEAFDDVPTIDLGTPIFVGDQLVGGVDAVLDGSGQGPGGGGIRGTVTDAVSGEPIEGIRVSCVDTFSGFVDSCSTMTAADGSYRLGGFLPAGSYRVTFRADDGFYATEWYDNVRPGQAPTPIIVETGVWSDGIDAALEPAGGFSGTVTNRGGGAYSLTTVTAYRWNGGGWTEYAETRTAYETEYELLGLPAGFYRVKFRGGSIFNPSFGIEEIYDDVLNLADGTDVVVSVGSVVSGIDAVLGNLDGGDAKVQNPSFDTGLDPWVVEALTGSSIHHGSVDVAGSALSGSAEIVAVDATGASTLSQCIAVSGGTGYRFGAWSQIAAVSGAPTAEIRLEFFDNAECAGEAIGAGSSVNQTGASDWRPASGVASAPATAIATRLLLAVGSGNPASYTARWDAAEVRRDDDVILADGFESGSTSAWISAP